MGDGKIVENESSMKIFFFFISETIKEKKNIEEPPSSK